MLGRKETDRNGEYFSSCFDTIVGNLDFFFVLKCVDRKRPVLYTGRDLKRRRVRQRICPALLDIATDDFVSLFVVLVCPTRRSSFFIYLTV